MDLEKQDNFGSRSRESNLAREDDLGLESSQKRVNRATDDQIEGPHALEKVNSVNSSDSASGASQSNERPDATIVRDHDFANGSVQSNNNEELALQLDKRNDREHSLHDSSTPHDKGHRYLPIVSGLLVPFSVLLDVPGLTERWYIRTVGFEVVETRPNPVLLDVGQAVSMAFGVAANIALVARFLEKWPLECTWIAIAALTLHDILQIVIVMTFGIVHSVDDGFTYGTAYWMTVASTAASMTVNVTLVIDLVRTKNFRAKGSGLTIKQRSLVIAVMALLLYIGLGSLCWTYLIEPNLSYIDSMYFTITTIESVGFGDITPNTTGARVFAFFYDTVGLVLLGFTIAMARETIIETFEASYRARRDRLAKKARERKEEKRQRLQRRRERREQELRRRLEAEGVQDVESEMKALKDNGMFDKQALSQQGLIDENDKKVEGNLSPITGASTSGQACSSVGIMTAANRVAEAQRELDYYEEVKEGMSRLRSLWRLFLRKIGLLKTFDPINRAAVQGRSEADAEDAEGRRLTRSATMSSIMSGASGEEQFKSFKKQIQEEQEKEFRVKLTIALSLFFVFWLVGAAVFHATEGWTYFEALYFCYIFFTNTAISARNQPQGKARKIRKRSKAANSRSTDEAIAALLAKEGYAAQEELLDVRDLPGKLTDAVKGFHDHARYFMLGRTGDPPERFRGLVEAASELEYELSTLADESEAGLESDTKRFLFMLAYERQFDVLLDAAEQVGKVFQRHQDELEQMKRLNAELREALRESQETVTDEDDGDSPSTERGLFEKRPPGGFEDEEHEEALEQELDGHDDAASGSNSQSQHRGKNKRRSGLPLLDTTSAMLHTVGGQSDQVRMHRPDRSSPAPSPLQPGANESAPRLSSFSPALSIVVDQARQAFTPDLNARNPSGSRTLTFADLDGNGSDGSISPHRERRASALWRKVRDAARS
ncbi:Potassium channel [Microbotryomycetes sp. JL221]|nr:Potassium channel [Microbotryomycetes sp. JL221]